MKVIINADDLGMSDAINDAVFPLMDEGKISSATIMAGGDGFEAAVQKAKRYPQCSFGVHLYLSDLRPLSSQKAFGDAGMLTEEGKFAGCFRRTTPSSALKRAIYEEWCCQISRVREAGIAISHLDSHQHVHTVPWLFGTIIRLQKTFQIHRMRQSLNWYLPGEQPPMRLALKKRVWNLALRWWGRTRTTDYLTPFRWFYANMTTPKGNRITRGVAELTVHSGTRGFEQETELLHTDWQSQVGCPIDLVSFNEL